jgi:biopolymer transport protein ExbD
VKLAAGRRPDPIVDLTPMIDVVFQLVLFFMVTTTFRTSPAIQVDLPRAAQDVVLADRDDLLVWIGVDGAMYLDDVAVDDAVLDVALARAAARDPETLVILKADRGTEHGAVVRVMDLARGHGLTRLAIATDPEPRPPR